GAADGRIPQGRTGAGARSRNRCDAGGRLIHSSRSRAMPPPKTSCAAMAAACPLPLSACDLKCAPSTETYYGGALMADVKVNPNGKLKGRVALVTGASRGIGEAI